MNGDISLKSPFAIEKLEFRCENLCGKRIIAAVNYDGEEIDNNHDGCTNSYELDFDMVLVNAGGELKHYSK